MHEKKRLKTGQKILLGVVLLIILLAGSIFFYASDYYRSVIVPEDRATIADIQIQDTKDALIVDPGKAKTALVFYPGGKVEHRAYESLMLRIAENGILCIVPKMPANLAVFDINAAARFIAAYPHINHWFVGGHSLGGSMAASFVAKKGEQVEGLVLLASYSTADLSALPLKVLSIYGSNDSVLNGESYQKYRGNLPLGFTELVIQGGNHAGFGSYGFQKGDGIADISTQEQQIFTADAIAEFCLATGKNVLQP